MTNATDANKPKDCFPRAIKGFLSYLQLSHVRHSPHQSIKQNVQRTISMTLLEENPAFTGRPETHNFAGILFDMDGTIVDSTDAIVKHWHKCVIFGRALCTRCISAYCV